MCPPPTHLPHTKFRGELGFLNFRFFCEVKIFLISGELSCEEGGYISLWRSVHSPSLFSFWNAKPQKLKKNACGALIFNIHIFRFKTDAGLQVDIDFNIESKFSFSRSSFFFTHQWALKTNQINETDFFFIHFLS